MAVLRQPFDQRHHLENVLRGARVVLRPLDSQRVEILEKRLDVLLGELIDRLAMLRGLLDDAVLDIGEVHHLRDLVALLEEDPAQQILEEEGAEVADVGIVVHRWTAGVHPNVALLDRYELFHPATHRVVQAQRRHGISRRRATAWAARASPLPIGPTWSVVVALRPTAAGSMPSATARLLRIASRYGASLGTSASSVTSTF